MAVIAVDNYSVDPACPHSASGAGRSVYINVTPNFRKTGPNLSAAWKAVGRDRYLLDRVVETFLDDLARLTEEIELSLTKRDISAVRWAAHTIKCWMQLFGVQPGERIADRLLTIARCDDCQATELIAALRHEFERVRWDLRYTSKELEEFLAGRD